MNQSHLPAVLLMSLLLSPWGSAGAQMLSIPVVQNAFSNPGVTVALNAGDGSRGQTFGAAAAWAPGAGRFVVSGGAAMYRPEERAAVFTWGLRGMYPVRAFMDDAASVGVFAGIGGATLQLDRYMRIPVGASVGWRRALGETRAVSLHAAPFADYWRLTPDAVAEEEQTEEEPASERASTSFRVGFGADIAVTRSIGITVGYETGMKAGVGRPGARGDILGVGVSYALRARQ